MNENLITDKGNKKLANDLINLRAVGLVGNLNLYSKTCTLSLTNISNQTTVKLLLEAEELFNESTNKIR